MVFRGERSEDQSLPTEYIRRGLLETDCLGGGGGGGNNRIQQSLRGK